MCGIVGFTSNQINEQKIQNFTKEVSHRGPDKSDYKILKSGNKYIHLGSSRLAIRGDERESMPMKNTIGNHLIYNGEIFDTEIIKDKLENKTYFGDTRMLLDVLTKNIKNISLINGMFAFSFYDKEKEKLFLARDKLGIKPLYYSIDSNDDIIFSSEVQSLIKYSDSKHYIQKDELSNLFIFNGITKKSNLIKNIKILEPGQLISFDTKDSSVKMELNFKNFDKYSLSDVDFDELLLTVLKDHLVADEKVDILLSGGIDSGLLAYVVKNLIGKDLNHFSLIFDDSSYSEEQNIKKIASTLSLQPNIFSFSNSNLIENVKEGIANMNSLVLDYSFIPTYVLAKEASNYTKAVISGDGADELFGGYEWYRGLKYFMLLPMPLKKIIEKLVNSINFPVKKYGYLNFNSKLDYFFKQIVSDPYMQMIIWQSPLATLNKRDIEKISKEISSHINSANSLEENYRNMDMNYFLYSNVLSKVDVASMANGLEVRPPFLDDRIVQFALENNTNSTSYLKTKLFLRSHIKNTEIEFLTQFKKHGFGFPLLKWFELGGYDEIKNMYYEKQLIYPENFSNNISNIFRNETLNLNNARELWAYYITSKWIDQNSLDII